MNAKKYLQYLQSEIHSAVFATVDENGNPSTCVIDLMLSDENGLYFLTAKGKAFYTRLKSRNLVSITGFHGEDTMSSKSVTVRGKVREIGGGRLPEIFEKNPYMAEIYPNEESRKALTVFQLFEGEGEFFDLSTKPIYRESFAFCRAEFTSHGYCITNNCNGCKGCISHCPQSCISLENGIAKIDASACLHCGNCYNICPQKAVKKQ